MTGNENPAEEKPVVYTRHQHVASQPRRRWRYLRRATIIVSILAGLWAFLASEHWMSRSLDYLLNRSSSRTPSAYEKARAQEVADLLLEIYQTLSEMRYLDPLCIKRGPHDTNHLKETLDNLNLDPAVSYLYSVLPYVECGQVGFFHGGRFADFRLAEEIERGRDPFYGDPQGTNFEDEDGPYMRPWVTPLSQLGNHQSIIIYNLRKHKIWIIDQEDWSSTDPELEGEDKAISRTLNRNAFDHLPSRSASAVLKDINDWYRHLKVLPGGDDDSGAEWNDPEMDLVSIYKENGWPEYFDGEDFEVDQARKQCALRAKYDSEEPLRVLQNLESLPKFYHAEINQAKALLLKANSEEEREAAKFEVWKYEYFLKVLEPKLAHARKKATEFCPNEVCQRPEDLPLWEFQVVKREYQYNKESLRRYEEEGASEMDADYRRAKRETATFQKAFVASGAAAANSFGESLESRLEAIPNHRAADLDNNQAMEGYAKAMKIYLGMVPESAEHIRKEIEEKIKQLEDKIAV